MTIDHNIKQNNAPQNIYLRLIYLLYFYYILIRIHKHTQNRILDIYIHTGHVQSFKFCWSAEKFHKRILTKIFYTGSHRTYIELVFKFEIGSVMIDILTSKCMALKSDVPHQNHGS